MNRLYTPEEAAEQLGHVTGYTIRGMVKRGEVGHVKGSSRKVLLTEDHIANIVALRSQPPRQPPPPADPVPEHAGFRTTARSRAHTHKPS